MGLPAADLARLSTLLDEAEELQPPELEVWLAGLQGESARLAPALRDLLARQASKETDDLLERPPAFALPAAGPAAGDTVGPYRLLSELGSGGMGAVWLAERADGTLKRKVALKLPHVTWTSGLTERFARERDILGSLEHPRIARLYDAGFDPQGRPFMALQYVEGVPIDVYCRKLALPAEGRLRLLLQVADAVAFAHSRLVLHRDLKPANILVTEDGQVSLLDFGVAKLMQGETVAETALTRESGRALTLDYASPEQVRGQPLGTASDVYSLGVVAFELLAGSRPYKLRHGSAAELEAAITDQEIPAASAVADSLEMRRVLRGDLDAVIGKALRKLPGERYASIDALSQDLRAYLSGNSVVARPDGMLVQLTRLAKRYRTLLIVGGLAFSAVVLARGLGATALVMSALLVGLAVAAWQARLARRQATLARSEARTAHAVQAFLLELFESTTIQQKDPLKAQQTTARELLEMGAKRMDKALLDAPESRAMVLNVLGEMHWQIGLRLEAARLKLASVEAARGAFGTRDMRFARIALDSANALEETPYRDQIPALLKAADSAFVGADAADHRDRIKVLRQLSNYYRYESLPECLDTAERAVTLMAGHDTANDELITAYRAAGRARIESGDFGLAERHYRAAVAVANAQGERRATWLVNARAELAEALFKQGKFEAAEAEAREAVALSLQAHGSAHRWTLIVRMRLANQLLRTGLVADARAHRAAVEAELAVERTEFDPQFRADMASYLGFVLPEQGRPDLAESLIQTDLDDLKRWFPRSASVATRSVDLALILAALGRIVPAEALAREGQWIWNNYAGEYAGTAAGHRYVAAVASFQRIAGHPKEALALLSPIAIPTAAEAGRWHLSVIERNIEEIHSALASGQAETASNRAVSELRGLRQLCGRYRLPHFEGRLLYLKAQAAQLLGEFGAAGRDYSEAIALRRPHDDAASLWLAELLIGQSTCALQCGDKSAATAALAEATWIHAQHSELASHWSHPLDGLRHALSGR